MSTMTAVHWGSPEAKLVAGSARVDAPDLADVLVPSLDWPAVLALASHHSVVPLLVRALDAAGWAGVPNEVVADLTRYRSRLAARNLLLAAELLAIVTLLDREGVACVPFKGPLLALSAYGDIALRAFGDLDILVPEADASRAKEILIAAGFRSLTPHGDARAAAPRPRDYAYVLRGERGVVVDVHWKVTPAVPLSLSDVLPRSRRTALLGGTVHDLAPEHSVLVQCVHGRKHGWSRLEWLAALAHTLEREVVDFDALQADADAHGGAQALALGLRLARRVLGAPFSGDRLSPAVARAARAEADAVCQRLVRADTGPSGPAGFVVGQLRHRRLAHQVRYLAHVARPSETDFAFVRLPRRLSGLYYVVRPVRVLVQRTPWRREVRRG